ncbi:MAG: RES family NAD+ phosphorylase [Gammaproteobacteria bacterium]|nr:RES family NAD+ phosphorylase [Gammaproteobacteria bacterium]MYK81369.1 RES family NAD+ phosphorylase [Gammaproteobacteria bacterium]
MIRGYDPDRLRAGLRAVLLEGVFRVIHRSHRDTPLAATPAPSRFSDPQMRYAVLYAASSVRCAFWETLGRNRFARRQRRRLPRSEVEARLVVSVRSEDTLSMIDLRGDRPLRIGASSAVAHDGNHAAGRALSAAVHEGLPEAHGFLFTSRFTGDLCVAVFDRAFTRLQAVDAAELVQHAEFLDALDQYDIVLTGPPA